VSLTRSEAVIALGKRLVVQLNAADDVLTSWMAHHVANLIAHAEAAPPAEKAAAEDACARAILSLWRHRSVLPEHLRPLEEVQAVLRTLAFLDLDPNDIRYYRSPMEKAVLAKVQGDAKQAIEIALGVDYTARVLIRMLLRQAAAGAAESLESWVKLAHAAGAEDAGEEKLLAFLQTEEGATTPGYGSARAALEDRAARLEAFANAAVAEANDLRQRLRGHDRTS
jgi:hypothetical protein